MVAVDELVAEILGIVLASDLLDNELFEEPKVPRYRHTKHALYLDSIIEKDINLEVL